MQNEFNNENEKLAMMIVKSLMKKFEPKAQRVGIDNFQSDTKQTCRNVDFATRFTCSHWKNH